MQNLKSIFLGVLAALVVGALAGGRQAVQTVFYAIQSGTWTVSTQSQTPEIAQYVTSVVTIDASPGVLSAVAVSNNSTSASYFLKFYNTTSPTNTTTNPVWVIPVSEGG